MDNKNIIEDIEMWTWSMMFSDDYSEFSFHYLPYRYAITFW